MMLRRKKAGNWEIFFWYHAPDGTLRKIHLTPNWGTGISKSEAQRLAVDAVAEKTKELDAEWLPRQKTLGELMPEYLKDLADFRRPQSVANMTKRLRHHIIPHLGGSKATPATAFSPARAAAFLHYVRQSGLVPASQHTVAREARAFAKWLMGKRLLTPSAYDLFCEALPLPKTAPPKTGALENYWRPEEWARFEATFDPSDPWLLFFETEYWGALRIGEILGLNAEDVLKDRPRLFVKRTRLQDGRLGDTKTANSFAPVDLPKALWERLIAVAAGLPAGTPLFFPRRRTSPTTARRIFDEHIAKAGVKHITLHGLRHSMASRLLNEGVNELIVAKHLRDTPNVVMKTYAHAMPDQGIMETRGPTVWDGKGKEKDPE